LRGADSRPALAKEGRNRNRGFADTFALRAAFGNAGD
jgi:hypothetical protein